GALLLCLALPSLAVTITVTNANDSGPGSLRAAIASASPDDIINFSLAYPATITLSGGSLVINTNLTINGPGTSNLAISGNSTFVVFSVGSGITVNISSVTVVNGFGRRIGRFGATHGGG